MTLTDDQLSTIRDFKLFAPRFLYVRPKDGGSNVLFDFNRAQRYLHDRLEKQKQATGKVRAVILKGRQQGCSTYVQARFFHQIITTTGKKAFILTHDQAATDNLFGIAKRYYDNLPQGLIPSADTNNAKQLKFKEFSTEYGVGTAHNASVGRSQTIHLFHGSEVGYWPNAEIHGNGIMDAISDSPNTEIILESTATGIGNYYHSQWCIATDPNTEFQAIFLPWYWQDEYKSNADNLRLTNEEEELVQLYGANGLTYEHIAWRRKKIENYSKDYEVGRDQFQSQYPFSADEAFKNPINQVFILSKYIARARKADVEPVGSLIVGVDVAISDRDRTAIIRRKGRHAYNLERFSNYNTMEIVGRIKRIITQENPKKVYIDCIGIGAGVVDRLQEMGYDCVEGVNVGRSANDKERFKNLRAELWSDMRDFFTGELPVQIPNDDGLHGELCSLGFKETSSGQLQIESKDELRKRGMPSPDCADALALTFYGGMHGGAQQPFEIPKVYPHEKGMFR